MGGGGYLGHAVKRSHGKIGIRGGIRYSFFITSSYTNNNLSSTEMCHVETHQ
jgi:hypothetical protein